MRQTYDVLLTGSDTDIEEGSHTDSTKSGSVPSTPQHSAGESTGT